MHKFSLVRTLQILLCTVLLVAILIYAKPFLVPLTFAAIIAMLLLPVCKWLQRKKLPQWLAVTLSVLLFLLVIGGIISVLAWQVSGLVKNTDQMQQEATKKIAELQQFIQQKTGVPVRQQSEIISSKTGGEASSYITSAISGLVAGLGGFLTDFILFLVYTFLLLLYRSHLKEFILKWFATENRNHASVVISTCRKVAQKYVSGLAFMIVCLDVMYTIGFSIVGVKNAFLFATLASVLETVPFIGNITGTLLTVLMTVAQGGSGAMVLGVFGTYLLVQFIQTYFLETLIVGQGVNINPLITIAGIVAGELIWGIPGMILTIPLLGIIKIVFDNVEPLKPIGFLMGEIKKEKK